MTAQTVAAATATNTSKALTVASQYESRFAAVLPDHIDAKQFLGLASGALYRDPKLMEAANNAPGAFMNALMRCAALGHQPGTEEFYLTPRKNKGRVEVAGIEGYRGIVERMYRSGAVASVIVREVCKNDRFEFVEGVNDKPVHEVDWFGDGRGEMIGVYAYAVLVTGAVSRVVILNRADVMVAKAKSEGASSDYSPWKTSERAMWWKTAARRLEPWVPTSAEYRREQLRAVAEAQNLRPLLAPAAVADADDDGIVHDAELVDDPADQVGDPRKLTKPMHNKIMAQFAELNITEHDGRVAYCGMVVGHPVESTNDLTRDEASMVIDAQVAELDVARVREQQEPPPEDRL